MTKVLDRIPPDMLEAYMAHKLSSKQLAQHVDCHPVYLRRLIKRPKREAKPTQSKSALIQARKAFRKSIAHLPTKEIQAKAHVSLTTAQRIKKQYA